MFLSRSSKVRLSAGRPPEPEVVFARITLFLAAATTALVMVARV